MQGDAVAIGAADMGMPRVSLNILSEIGRYSCEEAQNHHEGFARGHNSGYQREVLLLSSSSLRRC